LMTYLPAFEALVREAGVAGVMGAYNRTNGEACCASQYLLEVLLRGKWGFEGYVVSDCGAIRDIYKHHKIAESPENATAMAVKAGCDLNCGCTYEHLLAAVGRGLLSENDIDRSLVQLMTVRFRLGMFDPEEQVPYSSIPFEVVESPANQALALEVARQSMVLLKNEDNFLPLSKDLGLIAVIGPNADDDLVLRGNYFGTPSESITVLAGIRGLVSPSTEVIYARGCGIDDPERDGFEEAVRIANKADVAVMVMGLSQEIEGEEGQKAGTPEGVTSRGDRSSLDLPGGQESLLQAVAETGTPVVLVLLNGSAIALNWASENLAAILEAWYPGQAGGRAVGEVLFGDTNPGGRLPVTFYKSADQLPPFEDYSMEGRTYRYFEGEVNYPFGFGLSYSSFEYTDLSLNHDRLDGPEIVRVSCEVKNIGPMTGDEVVQIYLRDEEASYPVPRHSLVGFKRVRLAPDRSVRVTFDIQPKQMACVDEQDRWVIEPGTLTVFAGGGQPGMVDGLTAKLSVIGKEIILES